MSVEQMEFQKPADRIFLTVDFDGALMPLRDMISRLGHEVHAVKLGQAFLLYNRWPELLKMLHATGNTTYLDIKSHEDPDQMAFNTKRVSELEFSYMSVHGSAEAENMVAAARNAGKLAIVAALSFTKDGVKQSELTNIAEANAQLAAEDTPGVCAVMCNTSQLEYLHDMPGVLKIATGIRMPGDSLDDQPFVATPAEALRAGADMLAIGRAITAQADPNLAMERILENMHTAL